VLALLGAVSLAQGGYIYLKAQLAQVLLSRSWHAALSGAREPRPWPWADTWAVARLSSARHDVDWIVLEGATGSTTAFAPGHVLGTAAPGEPGHVALAAHRDTHFAFLERVALGDRLRLEPARGPSVDYEVDELRVVHERDAELLSRDEPRLSLVTCYPFDAALPGGPLRYVVSARPLAARRPGPLRREGS
jgi:sortase A